jgi:hypothetical protein
MTQQKMPSPAAKVQIPAPIVAGVLVLLLAVIAAVILWTSTPHPHAPPPGTVIHAPKAAGSPPGRG